MKLKQMIIALMSSLSLFSLSSCDSILKEEIDKSKLYIGGYPYSQDVATGYRYDHFLYVDILQPGEQHKEHGYDFFVNLSSGTLDTSLSTDQNSFGMKAGFYDVAPEVIKNSIYDSISGFFDDGGSISFFTSMGLLNTDEPCVSLPVSWNRSGVAISVSTISETGEQLTMNVANVYHQKLFGSIEL